METLLLFGPEELLVQTDWPSFGHDPRTFLVEHHEGSVVHALRPDGEAALDVRVVVGALQACSRRNVVVVSRHGPDDPGVHVLPSLPDHPLAPSLRDPE